MLTYKNNHTTSTKCQYQAAASNPKWFSRVKWWFIKRNKQTVINNVPIITWNPWNPVAIKKVEPYTLSEIENGAPKYSYACTAVNIKAKNKVVILENPGAANCASFNIKFQLKIFIKFY